MLTVKHQPLLQSGPFLDFKLLKRKLKQKVTRLRKRKKKRAFPHFVDTCLTVLGSEAGFCYGKPYDATIYYHDSGLACLVYKNTPCSFMQVC